MNRTRRSAVLFGLTASVIVGSSIPAAVFSPLAMTISRPSSSRSSGTTCMTASRPGLPMMSPMTQMRSSLTARPAFTRTT